MSTIDTVLSGKSLLNLVDTPTVSETVKPKYTQEKVELVLKCLKWQRKCSETEGNEEFIGLSDGAIAKKAGLALEQVQEIKVARDAKIAELTAPEVEPVEE